jgi:hypothetical protein
MPPSAPTESQGRLPERLRVSLPVFCGIRHRDRRVIVGQDAATFPMPAFVGDAIQHLPRFPSDGGTELLRKPLCRLVIIASFGEHGRRPREARCAAK